MNKQRKPIIWIVEDEPEIACLFAEILIDFRQFLMVCVDDATHVNAQAGDIIFLDMRGTKARTLKPNGARVITMSGDYDLKPEIAKPFNFAKIREILLCQQADSLRERLLREG